MNLPKFVEINEVCPRDGLQSLEMTLPAETKIKLLNKLIECGFKKIEAVSFVSPKYVPQMADAKEVLTEIHKNAIDSGVNLTALVPNLKGAAMANSCGVTEIHFVISVTEKHNIANTNQKIEDSLMQLQNIRVEFPNLFLVVSIASSFGCTFQGVVKPNSVINLVKKVLNMGANKIVLADTTGTANPVQVAQLLKLYEESIPGKPPSLHFHNTWGMGLANVLTALQLGYTEFDSSIGGLGGCPFAPGATGNIATEDLNNMLINMGINTSVNQEKLLSTLAFIKNNIISSLTSHMSNTDICLQR